MSAKKNRGFTPSQQPRYRGLVKAARSAHADLIGISPDADGAYETWYRAELQAAIDRVHAAHPGMRIELEADRPDQVRGFLGLRGVVLIGHGATSVEAVKNGTLAAAEAVRAGLVENVANSMDGIVL